MFGRRQRPFLELFVDCTVGPSDLEQLVFSMENQGRALARHVGWIASSSQMDVVRGTGGVGFNVLPEPVPGMTTFAWSIGLFVVHPIPVRVILDEPVLFKRRAPGPVELKVTWYCEHMRYRERVFTFG
jgi:hypothetical protein